jgi:hypothetical protein
MGEYSPSPQGWLTKQRMIYIGVAVILAAAVGGWFLWRQANPDISNLANDLRSSMNHTLSTDPQFTRLNLTVDDVTVMHQSDNSYLGVASVHTPNHPNHDVTVHVTYDGQSLLWNTDAGAFMWAGLEQFANP